MKKIISLFLCFTAISMNTCYAQYTTGDYSANVSISLDSGELVFTNQGFWLIDENFDVEKTSLTELEAGYISTRMYVKNTSNVPENICKITVLYKDGVLIGTTLVNKTIDATCENAPGEELITVISVPRLDESSRYTVSEFVWGGLDSLVPLTKVLRLNSK